MLGLQKVQTMDGNAQDRTIRCVNGRATVHTGHAGVFDMLLQVYSRGPGQSDGHLLDAGHDVMIFAVHMCSLSHHLANSCSRRRWRRYQF